MDLDGFMDCLGWSQGQGLDVSLDKVVFNWNWIIFHLDLDGDSFRIRMVVQLDLDGSFGFG